VDLHVHDAHFIRLLFGMPTAVASVGRLRGETVEYCNTQFEFADPTLVVTATSGVVRQQGRPFTHGVEIHFEQATVFFEFAVLTHHAGNIVTPLTVLTATGDVVRPTLPEGDPMIAAFVSEIGEMARCVEQNVPSTLLGGEFARDAIILCHRQTASVRSRSKVTV